MSFPANLPDAGASNTTDTLASAGHTALHNTDRDNIRALAQKVGIGSSAPSNNMVLVGNGAGTSAWTNSISNLSLDTPNINNPTGLDKTDVGLDNVENLSLTDILDAIFYVGFIIVEHTGVNPGTRYGVGTWALTAVGRSIVGVDSDDTDFDTAGETGGAKTHTLTTAEMPSHLHSVDPPSTTSGGQSATHTHTVANNVIKVSSSTVGAQVGAADDITWGTSTTGNASVNHTHAVNIAAFNSASAGSGDAHNNLSPYQAEYVWQRTA